VGPGIFHLGPQCFSSQIGGKIGEGEVFALFVRPTPTFTSPQPKALELLLLYLF
jgi:hypothetical protein